MSAMNLDPLASYVKQREGQRVIRKILISNNGMAAVKAEVGGNAFPGKKVQVVKSFHNFGSLLILAFIQEVLFKELPVI